MPSVVSHVQTAPARKRRVHAKSRKGCGNCKLRRVKCDEARPKCKKCLLYGVSCDYDGAKPFLDLTAKGTLMVDLMRGEEVLDFGAAPEKSPVSLNKMNASMVRHSLFHTKSSDLILPGLAWRFSDTDMETLHRFQTRTVSTIGTKESSATYRDCIAHMAFSHPYLMHMVLSLTLLHDTHLSPHLSPSAALAHWSTATKLFSALLARPIPPSARDAIWATGALIGTASMAFLETTDPHHAWPLKRPEPNDLSWLKLTEGKRAVWDLSQPYRPESLFSSLGKHMNHLQRPAWASHPDFAAVPPRWAALFDITPASTVDDNVYYFPLLCILRARGETLSLATVMTFLRFLLYMTPAFRARLEIKDPRAMLLLLWWFRSADGGCDEVWWVQRRAVVEGRAIEIWLERWYGGEEGLISMFESARGGDVGTEAGPVGVLTGCEG